MMGGCDEGSAASTSTKKSKTYTGDHNKHRNELDNEVEGETSLDLEGAAGGIPNLGESVVDRHAGDELEAEKGAEEGACRIATVKRGGSRGENLG